MKKKNGLVALDSNWLCLSIPFSIARIYSPGECDVAYATSGQTKSLGNENRATKLLTSLGLEDQLSKLPKQLSGGQSQRVAIARALANDPMLLLADEPTGNLDTASSTNVQNILKELAHEYGRAVIIVTHDVNFAATADRVIHIVDGKIQV